MNISHTLVKCPNTLCTFFLSYIVQTKYIKDHSTVALTFMGGDNFRQFYVPNAKQNMKQNKMT